MSSQQRLHIARITPFATDFMAEFQAYEAQVTINLARGSGFDLQALWDFAQYLDLVDAGVGRKDARLYDLVVSRCRAHLWTHGDAPAVQKMVGRTCSLADLWAQIRELQLDDMACNAANLSANVC